MGYNYKAWYEKYGRRGIPYEVWDGSEISPVNPLSKSIILYQCLRAMTPVSSFRLGNAVISLLTPLQNFKSLSVSLVILASSLSASRLVSYSVCLLSVSFSPSSPLYLHKCIYPMLVAIEGFPYYHPADVLTHNHSLYRSM